MLVVALTPHHGVTAQDSASPSPLVVDTFEDTTTGAVPNGWVYVTKGGDVWAPERAKEEGEQFFVTSEGDNQFLRLVTKGEAQRYTKRNGKEFEWNLNRHPHLRWRWRALELPKGASEKDDNDAGAAIYITFGKDWLGRPKSIKYTYSSSLPVGTVVEYGPLRVIVVDSRNEPYFGEWKTIQRDVGSDYRQVFGGSPPNRPISITLWSDSDTTGGTARVDFDDIMLLPPR